MFRLLCCVTLSLLTISPCWADIIECQRMDDIFRHVTERTLVILDVDNTLIEPVQELGNDQWFHYRIKQRQAQGQPWADALERTIPEWVAIQNVTQVKLVEEGCDEIVSQLQRRRHPVMGMTTRGLGMSTRTVEQLRSVGIDLSKTSPTKEELFFTNINSRLGDMHGVLFCGGILFTAGTDKGSAFAKFLDTLSFRPTAVVFVNDKRDHITPIEEVCKERGISFVGLRYGFLDAKVKSFRPEVTDVQFEHFGHILSDAQAVMIARSRSEEQTPVPVKVMAAQESTMTK